MRALGEALQALSAHSTSGGPGGAETTEGGIAMLQQAQALESQRDLMQAIQPYLREQVQLWKEQVAYAKDFGNILGGVVQLLAGMGGSWGEIGQGIQTALAGVDQLFNSDNWAEAAAGIQNVVKGFRQATDSASGFQRALGGAAVGAKIGGNIGMLFGPVGAAWGKVIGGLIGAVAGIFAKPSWVEVGEKAGRVLGMAVSKEFAKEIEKTMKELHVSAEAAALLHLTEAMEQSGRSASSFGVQAIQLLTMVKSRAVPAALGIAEVGKAFAMMAEEAAAAGGKASDAMVKIIEATEALGIIVPEVQRYVVDQFTALVDVSVQLLEGWQEQFETGKISADEFVAHVASSAVQVYAMFNRLIAQGVSLAEVYRQLGPLLDAIRAGAEAGNIEITGPGSRIFDVDAIVQKHKKFFDEIGLQVQKFQYEMNTGIMNPALLNDYAASVQGYYEQLIKFGLTPAEALAVIAPLLAGIEEGGRRLHVALDPATQSLIDTAHASGLIKTDPMATMVALTQLQVDLLAALVEAVGGVLPQSWLDARDALHQYNQEAGRTPSPPNPEPDDRRGGRNLATGGFVSGPDSGYQATLHGPEVVVPRQMFGHPLFIPPQGGPAVPIDSFRGWIPDSLPLPEPPSIPRAAGGGIGPGKAVLDAAMHFARSGGPPVDVQAIVAELVATRAVMARVVGDLATRPVSVQVDGREIVRTVIDVGIRGDGELLSASRDGLGGRRRG